MEDLFNQLKSEGPLHSSVQDKQLFAEKKSKADILSIVSRTNTGSSSPRRESMPPPSSAFVVKKANKSRSLSPPKVLVPGLKTKPVKVRLQRKGFEDLLVLGPEAKPKTPKQSHKKAPRTKNIHVGAIEKAVSKAEHKNTLEVAKKVTPTKAQQKLFDPAVLKRAQLLKEFKIKRCLVRLQRKNLKNLQTQMSKKNTYKKQSDKKTKELPTKAGQKRKSVNTSPSDKNDSPKAKRGRPKLANGKDKQTKSNTSFFIKLTTSPPKTNAAKMHAKKLLQAGNTKERSKFINKISNANKRLHDAASQKKLNHKTPKITTTPTKFTRSQLIKTFGRRPFRSHVRIERCTHPMMLIFESNARARKLQSKRNKSKNLSVSFREQVEIFGDSDDDSDFDGTNGSINVMPSTSQAAHNKSSASTTSMPVMPARLKKVENGKVVDDIELDTSLFIDPTNTTSSTPFPTAVRKKREKKSYSPLKDDGTPSPHKERLKLANEKLPPSGLRRLNIDEIDDEDDEDDDCEYIVPTEVPQRRASRASSTNACEERTASNAPSKDVVAEISPSSGASKESLELETSIKSINSNKEVIRNETEESCSSFVSAIEQNSKESSSKTNDASASKAESTKTNSSVECEEDASSSIMPCAEAVIAAEKTKCATVKSTELRSKTPSPVASLNSLNDLIDLDIYSGDDVGNAAEEITSEGNSPTEPSQSLKNGVRFMDKINKPTVESGDISLKSYIDEQTLASTSFQHEESVFENIVSETSIELPEDV